MAEGQVPRTEMESLFISSLPDIQRVSRFLARRHRLSRAETDDFCGEVSLAIIAGKYAVLSSFQGRSSLRTYLTTVIQRIFLDYRRRLWESGDHQQRRDTGAHWPFGSRCSFTAMA